MKNLSNSITFRDKAPGNRLLPHGKLLFLMAVMFVILGFQPAQAVVSAWTSIPSPIDSGCDISLVVSGSITASSSETVQDQTFTSPLSLGGSTTTSSSPSLTETPSASSTDLTPSLNNVTFDLASAVPAGGSSFTSSGSDASLDGNIYLFQNDSTSALDSSNSNINMLEIVAVPEPSMWSLALGGFAVLLGARKMRGIRAARQIA